MMTLAESSRPTATGCSPSSHRSAIAPSSRNKHRLAISDDFRTKCCGEDPTTTLPRRQPLKNTLTLEKKTMRFCPLFTCKWGPNFHDFSMQWSEELFLVSGRTLITVVFHRFSHKAQYFSPNLMNIR